MTSETHTIRTDAIVAGGDAMARHPDGYVIFVPRGAANETVEIEFVESHKQWRRGRILRVVEPSSERVDAPCPHYAACGGCQLQHLSYAGQLAAKSSIVMDAFRRIGKIEIDPVTVEASERVFEYRNRLSFVLTRAGGSVAAGFHRVDNPARLVDIDACPLAESPIAPAWTALRTHWGPGAALLPGGDPLRLTLRATARGVVALVIEGARNRGELAKLMEHVPQLAAIWAIDANGKTLGHVGAETLSEQSGEFEVPLAERAFVQVNRDVAARLNAYALTQCGELAGKRVIDAYCGFGGRALELTRAGAIVTGIDIDRVSIAAARELATREQLATTFIDAPVERALGRALPADLVVLNPPRRGVAREALGSLLDHPPETIVYISCDPATLARDLRVLSPRFELQACRAYDLFPQTAHIETVATMVQRAA